MQYAQRIDAAAIGVSTLCILHCLALPFFASLLPILTSAAEAEWAHKALVIASAPLAFAALLLTGPGQNRLIFAGLAIIGVAALFAGAFVHEFHDYEKILTAGGALTLASAHLFRWRCHADCECHETCEGTANSGSLD